ncbi:hypothetical protein ACRAWG_06165 [Methylobacterium sp. P31]
MDAEALFVVILSLICLIAGVVLAAVAAKRPVQKAALESAGGGLIALGLVIIGAGLSSFR